MNKRRIGIYPGTFDPVHQGHIGLVQEAMRTLSLDEVVLLPEPRPRGKEQVTSLTHRSAMLTIAAARVPGVRVVAPSSEQFTVHETLPMLERMSGGADMVFLMGSDVARSLPYWEECERLVRAVSFVIGMRDTDTVTDVEQVLRHLEVVCGVPVRYTLLTTPHPTLTSSQVRASSPSEGGVIPDLVPYIQEHRLYES